MVRSRTAKFCLFVLLALTAGGALSCVKRQFNTDAETNTLFHVAQPRIAIDYLGLGWCYYLEDKSSPVSVIKTDLVDEVLDTDLKTGIETRSKYQVVYTVRQFNRAHPTSIDFDAIADWRSKNQFEVNSSQDDWATMQTLQSELSNARAHIYYRKMESAFCKSIVSDSKTADLNFLKKNVVGKSGVDEYVVRCYGDTGELMTRSHLEQLSESGYQLVRKVLSDVTTAPQFAQWKREGAQCRQTIRQMEVSRGQHLGTEKKKVF